MVMKHFLLDCQNNIPLPFREQLKLGLKLVNLLKILTHLPTVSFRLTSAETRVLFREKGWRTVVGFQTRNIHHLGHEYVQKTALTFVDGLFINPVIGKKKAGDFKDEVILDAFDALIRHYYLKDMTYMRRSITSIGCSVNYK